MLVTEYCIFGGKLCFNLVKLLCSSAKINLSELKGQKDTAEKNFLLCLFICCFVFYGDEISNKVTAYSCMGGSKFLGSIKSLQW